MGIGVGRARRWLELWRDPSDRHASGAVVLSVEHEVLDTNSTLGYL